MALVVKNSLANAGDIRVKGLILGLGRSLGEGHGNPHQYSCLENPMDRGAWQLLVHGGREESDMTEPLTLSFSIFSTNGAGATRCQYASE